MIFDFEFYKRLKERKESPKEKKIKKETLAKYIKKEKIEIRTGGKLPWEIARSSEPGFTRQITDCGSSGS